VILVRSQPCNGLQLDLIPLVCKGMKLKSIFKIKDESNSRAESCQGSILEKSGLPRRAEQKRQFNASRFSRHSEFLRREAESLSRDGR
jgi:hypothetical protein